MAAMHPGVIRGAVPINGAVFVDNPDLAGLAFMDAAPDTVPGVGGDIKQPGVTELAYADVPVPAIRQIYALMSVRRELLPRIQCLLLMLAFITIKNYHPGSSNVFLQISYLRGLKL
jgi:carboxylesterase